MHPEGAASAMQMATAVRLEGADGAWVGRGTMIDSHVLVGSCAQVGEDVHLSAAVQVGGVLEPAGARPVIVEDGRVTIGFGGS